jgi:Fe-S cluster biogenesis protein NfuA
LIPFTDEELEPAVKDVIDKVRPSIKLDGGDIELIAVWYMYSFKVPV